LRTSEAGLPAFVPVMADASGEGARLASVAMAGCAIEIEVHGMIVRVRGLVAAGAWPRCSRP
jgi:hypothetical protein